MKKLLLTLWCLAIFGIAMAQEPEHHWTVISGTQYTMMVNGVVFINGVEQMSSALEVGAFYDDECRASSFAVFFPPTQQYVVALTIVSNQVSGETITFRLYNHDTNEILEGTSSVEFENLQTVGGMGDWFSLEFISSQTYTVSATANPAEGGTVTGAGSYPDGASCTLTATANTGYTFANWTKDGEVVSYNASYTFTVTESAAFVANFNSSGGSGYHWTPNSGPYANTATLIGIIQINGVEQTLTTLEVGAFCDNECRGREKPMYVSQLDRYFLFMNLYGNDGDELSFRLYDHTLNQESTLTCASIVTFVANNTYGSFPSPYVLNFEDDSPATYIITATANPTEGGTITGTGSYPDGESCTLAATANEGYTFVNWTKDGEVVSSNASYTFTVTESAAFVANFQINSYEITATANPTAGGTITGAGTFNYGASCTLAATANEGYTFVNWTKDGEVVSSNASYTFTVTESAAFVANFQINSYEITASANPTAGGTITGAGSYNYGASCTLAATANEGYTFVNWTKDGEVVSSNASYTFNVTESAAFVANFQINSYEITATANPTAGGTITGTGTFNHGESCTLTATANTGYTFANWTKDGEVVSSNASYTFTVTESAAFVANFQINSYEITATTDPSGAGTITGAGSYNHGANCTLSVTANPGYTFVNWTKGGVEVSTNTSFSFTVTEDADYVAHFDVDGYEITATANPTAGGTISGTGAYTYGTSVTLTATANEGYTFINWTKDGEVVSSNASYTFTVTESAAFVANFQINSYEITATANPTAGGTITGTGSYNHGASCTLTATANEGYTFVNWTKDGEVVSSNAIYTFNVTESAAFVANFQINSYEITATANPTAGGTITGAGSYNYSASCTLAATANEGYTFVNWTKDGEVVSSNASYTFTVTESAAFVANFQINSYEITATANPTAGGTITGAGSYNYGASCTLAATANEGYTFVNWTKDGEVVSSNASYTFTVTESAAFVANFQINSYEITATTDPSGAGTITGAGSYNHGANCTLAVTANPGYTFINWTKDGVEVSTNTSFSFTVTEDADYVAHFDVNGYEITATANPTAGGTISGTGAYTYGTSVTLTATANEGYTFINWTKDGEVVSSNASYTFTVTESAAFVANFQINSYEITATANPTAGGTITGAGSYNYGASCTLTVTTNPGHTFINWTKDGVEVSTNTTFSFVVTEDAAYVANFQVHSYEITATANPSIGGNITGAGSYNYGSTCTLTATASTGYSFVNWTKDGEVVSTSPNYSFTVTEAASFIANFSLNSYQITVTANPTTGGSVTGGGTFNHGDNCTLTATPNENYIFINWTKNGTIISTSTTYSFTVTEAGNYVANFAANEFQITAIANPANGGTVTGSGVYNYGTTATLTATANTGFTFINWTKDGIVVSTNASFNITVTESATYVAHFNNVTHEIIATANPTEGGSVTGSGTYGHGSTCTLSATANAGYIFANWTKDGSVVSTHANYSFIVTEDATYVANFMLNMCLITVTADPTIGGTVAGGAAYNYGDICTVHAMPNAGYSFVNWTKNGTVVSNEANYTFTVTESANLVAHFSLEHYNIMVSVDPEAWGTATGGGSFTYGQTCTLTATPNTGYAFVNWTKDGTVVSNNASYSFTVNGNGNYVAHFAVARYTLTVLASPAEGGSVSGAGTYQYGSIVTLHAVANEGYIFINWTKDGDVISTNATHAVSVREDAEYVANFRRLVFEIKAKTDPEYMGDIAGTGFYNYGETCTLTVTPHTDYEFVNWTLNGEVVSEEASFSFVVTEAHLYIAHLQYVEGVPEQSDIKVSLFPNPAKDKLTIETSEPINMLEIYNLNGAMMYRQDNCSEKIEINVDNYAIGTYIIRLTTDNAVEIRRFVKD